jgi:predicted NACHT family NTPase
VERSEFRRQLEHIRTDAIRERQVQDLRRMDLGLEDVLRAFVALQAHAHEFGDLFYDTLPPTDEALLVMFAFLVLP